MPSTSRILSLFCALALVPGASLACLHGPAEFPGELGESGQRILIFHQDGREELVLAVSFESTAPVESLAWVIPVPSLPDHYETVDAAVFEDLSRVLWDHEQAKVRKERENEPGLGVTFGGGDDEAEFEVHEMVCVGRYQIQPIEVRGPEAGPALDEWLVANGFSSVPAESMAYYLERRYVFLAVKVVQEGGLGTEGDLAPLRVSFASETIYYPVKFSSHQGSFEVTLDLIGDEDAPFSPLAEYLEQRFPGFEVEAGPLPISRSSRYPALRDLWHRITGEQRMSFSRGQMVRITGRVDGARTAEWPEDFHLPASALPLYEATLARALEPVEDGTDDLDALARVGRLHEEMSRSRDRAVRDHGKKAMSRLRRARSGQDREVYAALAFEQLLEEHTGKRRDFQLRLLQRFVREHSGTHAAEEARSLIEGAGDR